MITEDSEIMTLQKLNANKSGGGGTFCYSINKNAAKRFGPLLTSINESKYPGSMSPMSSSKLMAMSSNSINNNSTSVYNYSLKVDASGTSANPNDIARIVMAQIKNVDSQRIRGNKY